MEPRPVKPIPAAELRRVAEQRLTERPKTPAGEDTVLQKLIHELQIHQIELEMQNEELQLARVAMETGLEKYSDLYDFAPVGYMTLDRDGRIREINLTATALFGIERSRLMGRTLGLIRRNGGAIEVDSVEGVGTTFHIDLPAVRSRTIQGPSPPGSKNPAPSVAPSP